jgi:aryl-alcohol dehydrogenase-like predicted oxidoreductase
MMAPQLCLGTAQFGLSYGITNTTGQVAEEEVRRILEFAAQEEIEFLDTAQAYGSSESVLGRCWPTGAKRRLISKLPAQAPPESWEPAIQASLKRLNAECLDGFLLHRPADLLGPQASLLLVWLESLRERELVKRIGVSIYDSSDLNGLPLDRMQLVQLPLSLYDQRLLLDGTVAQLQAAGLAVHGRSLMLQGLLVQPEHQWPEFLSPAFRSHHRELTRHLEGLGMTLLEGALAFARSCKNLEAALLGVQSLKELNELLSGWKRVTSLEMGPVSTWAWSSNHDLDPRFWTTW